MKRAHVAILLALGIPAFAAAGQPGDQGTSSEQAQSSSTELQSSSNEQAQSSSEEPQTSEAAREEAGEQAYEASDHGYEEGYGYEQPYAHGAWDRWYVTPFIGAIIPDHKRGLVDDDYLYGFAIGKELGPFLNLELNASWSHLNNRPGFAPFGRVNPFGPFGGYGGGGHLGLFDISLDALGILNRGGFFAPYGVLGVGLIRDVYSSPFGDATHFAPELGIGAYVNLWENNDGTQGFSLRPEIKARWDNPGGGIQYFNRDFVDYVATLGFQFSFGGTPPEHHEETYYRAPPPPVTQAPPPPPAPAPAPAPSVLPAHGQVTLTGVTFAHNSARLTSTSDAVLDEMATGLIANPGLKIEIQGHTDSTGSAAYNQRLSQRRADAVREYLIDHGVNADQVVARGYGESEPIESNSTAAGRAANRRVVAKVLSNPSNVAIKGEGATHLATPAVPE